MMARSIIDEQTNPAPAQDQLFQEPYKRSLILPLRKREHKRTLATCTKDADAFILAVNYCNRAAEGKNVRIAKNVLFDYLDRLCAHGLVSKQDGVYNTVDPVLKEWLRRSERY